MRKEQQDVRIRVDGYTRVCLTVIAVVLTLVAIGLWSDVGPIGRRAQARTVHARDTIAGKGGTKHGQVSARTALLEEQKRTTAKVQELVTLLRSGQVKVKVASLEGVKDGTANK